MTAPIMQSLVAAEYMHIHAFKFLFKKRANFKLETLKKPYVGTCGIFRGIKWILVMWDILGQKYFVQLSGCPEFTELNVKGWKGAYV